MSSAFLRALRSSHSIQVRATVPDGYTTGTSPVGEQFAVVDGTVTLDSTAQVMGSLTMDLDGTGWSTQPGRNPVQPYGNEVYLERGVQVGGTTEYVGLGYYQVTEVEQAVSPNGNLTVTGSDRMQGIIDSQVIAPVQFAAASTVDEVFRQLVGAVYPEFQIEYDWEAGADELTVSQVTTTDRYGFLTSLLTARGKIMYWDYRGVLVVKTQPLDSAASVWDVTAGPQGVIISGDRVLSRDNVFNAMVVQSDGASTSDPAFAVAYDNNPSSPTYWYGKYGQVPQFYSDSTITSSDQAMSAAKTMLAKAIQLNFQVTATCIPNPALEPYDVTRVNYGGTSPDEFHIIDSLEIPLTAADAMQVVGHDPSQVQIAAETA